MTEVMVHSSVGESFSFAKPELEQIHPKKESDMLIGDDIEDESTLSLNSKLDNTCDRSSESTICGSNSDDSVVSNLQTSKSVTDMAEGIQDSATSTIKSDTSCEDYEYMTTETTVINTMYNVISQSGAHSLEKESNDKHSKVSQSLKNDKIDKSRVIVQILSSDPKDSAVSQKTFQNKRCDNENLSTHSFRDDVFKMLSKPRSTLAVQQQTKKDTDTKQKDSNLDFKELFNTYGTGTVQTIKHIKRSRKIVQTRRRKGFIIFNKGRKLSDIEHVSVCLKTATANALRILHYVMYGSYGICGNEPRLASTRKNISHFSGYPFDSNSIHYEKRLRNLWKIPFQVLCEVHEAIFGKTPVLRQNDMINNLMAFFADTEKYDDIVSQMKLSIKYIPEEEYINLKERAKSGPLPVVLLERLGSENSSSSKEEVRVQEMVQIKENLGTEMYNAAPVSCEKSYALPAYILKGPGKKLKHFPAIVRNLEDAEKKEINLLHYLLYGRMEEEVNESRRNILEFSGFLECQNEFITEMKEILSRLDATDLLLLCKILCLRAKTNTKELKISKIMNYLKAPHNPFKVGRRGHLMKYLPHKTAYKRCGRKRKVPPGAPSQSKMAYSESRALGYPVELWDEPENAECTDGGYRLRDFRKICTNIECSAPSDLTELNDLLFTKPSDETEIHDKILNFTRFGFTDTSIHYHYRKTLLFYMGPCIVRKIAKLLDIENWNMISSHEDLSACVLRFLMEKKSPDSSYTKSSLSPSFSKSFMDTSFADKSQSPENDIPLEVSQRTNQESMYLSSSSVNTNQYSPDDHVYLSTELESRNDAFAPNCFIEDDSVPLRDFIHHPTDQELKQAVDVIVQNGLFNMTLGDVVKRVYLLYPCFNLSYRENFIKSETRKIVSKLRQNAVETVKQNFSA